MFTQEDATLAYETWGANCGPGALAAILHLSLDDVRTHLLGFDAKRYTNPSMMRAALNSLGVTYTWMPRHRAYLPPMYGLARVQWAGPWTAPNVPARVAYRHTHWIASRLWQVPGQPLGVTDTQIFDINCMVVGGWVSFSEWGRSVVPWLVKRVEPKANGDWWFTHVVEVERTYRKKL